MAHESRTRNTVKKAAGESTRDRLLAAATREFAEKGFKGARIASIAKHAGANLQAAYYHFGDKEKLYTATLNSIFHSGWFESVYEQLDTLPPTDAILFLVNKMFDTYLERLDFYTLIVDQNTLKARHLKRMKNVVKSFQTLEKKLANVLEAGAQSGVLRPGLDPALVFISIGSLSGNYLHNIHTHSAVFDRDFAASKETDQWRRYIGMLILDGLRTRRGER